MNDSNWWGLRDEVLNDPYGGCHWCREAEEQAAAEQRQADMLVREVEDYLRSLS